jgi:hypothetical protein
VKRSLIVLAVLVPAAFYLATTARTVGQADQAILVHSMSEGVVSASATHHNLTVLTGYAFFHLLPLPEIAFRCNLVSTFYGTLTVATFFLLALRLTGSSVVSALSAAFVMVAHTMWWHSTIAENYATSAFISAAVLYCLVRYDEKSEQRWLVAAGAAAGFWRVQPHADGDVVPGILLAALVAPAASWRARLARAVKAGLWIAVGLLPFAIVFLMELGRTHSLDQTAWEALGSDFVRLFFSAESLRTVREAVASTGRIFMLQWGWPSLSRCTSIPTFL